MNLDEMIQGTRDAMKAEMVYGEPIERDGLLVVPAAKVSGGGGGGRGTAEGADAAEGTGGGFGVMARPAGAWIIRGDKVEWQPALDLNRVILGGQIVAIVLLLVLRSILKSRH
jgi:uncharacterized spore protein YtfJ